MDTTGNEFGIVLLIMIGGWLLGLLILYAIIKAAVKNAMVETLNELRILNWMSNVYTAIGRPEESSKPGSGLAPQPPSA